MTETLFANQVIQIEWQALAGGCSIVAGALVAAAKIVAGQMAKSVEETNRRHEQNRADAREARDENRALSQAILTIQGKTVEALTCLQGEIERVVARLDRLEDVSHGAPAGGSSGGSKAHRALGPDHR